MQLNEHSELRGKHSIYSPSQPSFFNYDPEDFVFRLLSKYRSDLGTAIHDWAATKIERCHKITSTKEMIKSIDEFIFTKYKDKNGYLTKDGFRVLKCLQLILADTPEVFETVRSYVNDAIGYKMYPEVILKFTDDFFGTADALIFSDDLLRIHDLKTGSGPVHIEQLFGYAALYCIEYHVDPLKIDYEFRIYQNNDILTATPDGGMVKPFVDRYLAFDNELRAFEGGLV